jgi:hypothetical protein
MEKILMRVFQLIKWQVNYHYLYHNKKKNHKRYHAVPDRIILLREGGDHKTVSSTPPLYIEILVISGHVFV